MPLLYLGRRQGRTVCHVLPSQSYWLNYAELCRWTCRPDMHVDLHGEGFSFAYSVDAVRALLNAARSIFFQGRQVYSTRRTANGIDGNWQRMSVVCCHVYDHITNVLANHLTVYGCSLVDKCCSGSGSTVAVVLCIYLYWNFYYLIVVFALGFHDQTSELCHKCYRYQWNTESYAACWCSGGNVLGLVNIYVLDVDVSIELY